MKNNLLLPTVILLAICWLGACQRDETSVGINQKPDLPATLFDYSLRMSPMFNIFPAIDPIDSIPVEFFGFGFNPANPQITNAGATLGRVLFYDPQLSLNNSTSCASCHRQELAFSDGVASSKGFAGATTPRNSMAIVNVGFNNNLFWDSRESNVKGLVTRPIQNHIEMGVEEMRRLEVKLAKVDYYPTLFQAAFGDSQVTEDRIASALSQFVCSITTSDSKFDEGTTNNFANFTDLERMGKELFFSTRTNCSRCHAGPNFAAPDFFGGEYGRLPGTIVNNGPGDTLIITTGEGEDLKGGANNGLEVKYNDPGIGNDRFRIPSLRNIALTAPYMHDGRFKTLGAVIEHYSNGVEANANLDQNLRQSDGSPLRPNFSPIEKTALLAFLNTLTDQRMVTDVKYSNPFK